MQIFQNRPLALLCASVASVSVIALSLGTGVKLLLLILFSIALLLLICLRKRRQRGLYTIFALLGAVIALSVSVLFFDCYFARSQEKVYEGALIKGTVVERRDSYADRASFGIVLESIDGERSGERVILECAFPSALQVGDYIKADVTQLAFDSSEEYDEETFYLSDGYTRIYTCDAATDYQILKENDHLLRIMLSKWNTRLSIRLGEAIGGEEGDLAVALLLGNRSFLDDSTRLDFQRAGVAHLLALSGMHVSVLVGFLELVLRRMRIAKMIRAFVIPSALLGYLMLTGFSPSTVRAVSMVCMLYLGFLLCADYDSFTALTFVLAILLTVTPYAVLDLSLWMSFLAAASIIVFYPLIREIYKSVAGRGKRKSRIRCGLAILLRAVLVSLVANAGLLPLIGFRLGEWSLASVPLTLLLALPMSALLILSVFLLLLEECFFFSTVCRFLSKIMLVVSDLVAKRRDVVFLLEDDLEKCLLLGLALLLLVLAIVKIKRKLWFATVFVMMFLLLVVSHGLTARQPLTYLPASEETGCFFVLSEGGEMIVVDDGETVWNDAARLERIAHSLRCSEVGDLILVQYDDRHAYLISSLSERIKIRRLRLPPPQNQRERAIASRLESEAALHGIIVCYDTDNLCLFTSSDPYDWAFDPPVDWVTVE